MTTIQSLGFLITLIVGLLSILNSIIKLTSHINTLDKDIQITALSAQGQRDVILEKITSSKSELVIRFEELEKRFQTLDMRVRRLENFKVET